MEFPSKIAFLGPLYSYSHLAAVQHFGSAAELVGATTISAVFDNLLTGRARFGVVPIENSTDGRIVDTLNVLARSPVSICSEVNLAVHHNLLAKCDQQSISELYSKPQAISQCREWISSNLPGVQMIDTASTTAAAAIAAEKPNTAAIASLSAGVHYGLTVLNESIEDRKHNITRFVILGEQENAPTGDDKTTLLLELAHTPGALADAMLVFKKPGLNLTWIESFPKPDRVNEYVFFLEFVGHVCNPDVKQSLLELKQHTELVRILGSYPRSPISDSQ